MTVKPEDLAAVALLIRVPNVIFAPAASPVRTAQDLVAAKARPGALNYGSSGSGGSLHMATEMSRLKTGTNLTHVPYHGAGPMLVEAVAGRLDAGCDNMPSCIGHIRDGRLRAVAVTSANRSPALPDVPTLAEPGVRDFEATAWFGVQAPAKTPRPIVERLGTELHAITRPPDYRARIAELGGDPPGLTPQGGTTPAAFDAYIPQRDRPLGGGGPGLRRQGGLRHAGVFHHALAKGFRGHGEPLAADEQWALVVPTGRAADLSVLWQESYPLPAGRVPQPRFHLAHCQAWHRGHAFRPNHARRHHLPACTMPIMQRSKHPGRLIPADRARPAWRRALLQQPAE